MKFFKRLFIGATILIGVVVVSAAVIAGFFEDQISDRLLTEINKQLDTELTVKEFDLSLLSGFPNASADLKGVVLKDKLKGRLLEAEKVSFRFGLLSLFGSSIKVNSVVIKDGAVVIRTTRKGTANYDILKKTEKPQVASTQPSDFSLSLEEALLEDVEVIYIDDRSKHETKVYLKDAVFSGEFSNDQFSLNSDAALKTEFIELDGMRYFAGKNINYGATIDVDLERGKYQFDNVELEVEGNQFHVDGTMQVKKNYTDYNLTLTGKDGDLESIFKMLPRKYQTYLGDFSTKGNFLFNTTIKGRQTASESPAINMNLSLNKGRITSKKLEDPLKDVSFTARFTNGKGRSQKNAVFEISDFKGYFSRELIESKLKIKNFEDPTIDFQFDGVIPLESVFGLFDNKTITDGDGEIEVKNLTLKGRYEDMINTRRIHRVKTSGSLEFDDAELVINQEKMILDKGSMSIKNNELVVHDVKLEGAGSEIVLEGMFKNVIPVLFADKENSKKAELKFSASLDSENLDLDRWVRMLTTTAEPQLAIKKGAVDSVKIKQIHERERITKFLKGTFILNVADLNYNKIEGQDFEGSLRFDNNQMLISGDIETMEGAMNLEGRAYFKDKPYLRAQLIADEIDFREFFRQAENFGQGVLKYQHLKGRLDSKIAIDAYWDEQGKFFI